MNTNPKYKEYGISVVGLTLIKNTSNTYKGLVEVTVQGNKHTVSINVIKDESSFMWETEPGGFAFLLNYLDYGY